MEVECGYGECLFCLFGGSFVFSCWFGLLFVFVHFAIGNHLIEKKAYLNELGKN